MSGACAGKATGSLALRDNAGGWYRVDMGTSCSACGPATFEGRDALGEICPDFSALQAQAQAEIIGIIDGTLP